MKMRLSTRIILGFALFLVLCILAMVIPEELDAKQDQLRVQISNDLKMLLLSALIYADENNGKLPESDKWADQLCLLQGTNKEPAMDPLQLEKILTRRQCGYAFNSAIAGKQVAEIHESEPVFFPVVQHGRNLSVVTNDLASFAWDKRGVLQVVNLGVKITTLERAKTGKR